MSFQTFGSGFKDGFGYYTALANSQQDKLLNEQRIKTEQLRQEGYSLEMQEKRETKDVRMATIAADSAFSTARAAKTDLESKEFIELAPQRRESANLLLESNRAQLQSNQIQLEEATRNLTDEKEIEAVTKLINISSLLTDPSVDTDVAASFLEDALIDLRTSVDFTKFKEDSYWQGWEAIAPKLESGDFEAIAKENPDALSSIFSESLNSFNGKNFVSKDGRQGVIQSVSLSGNFDPISGSANTLVEGKYNVLFNGETEPEEVSTYMPDNARNLKTITEDIEGNDAKVVSISDIVDKVAAEKDFAMMLVNNPKMLETFTKASKGATNFKGNSAQIKDKADTYFKLKDGAGIKLGNIFKTAKKAQEATSFGSESSFLSSLYDELPFDIASKHIVKEVDPYEDDGFVYKYADGSNEALIQDDFTKTYMNPEKLAAEVENTYARFNSFSKKNPGQKAVYQFDGIALIDFDKSRAYIDATLEDTFGKIEYDQYRADASILFTKSYPGKNLEDASDAEFLAFMEAFINRRRSIGR